MTAITMANGNNGNGNGNGNATPIKMRWKEIAYDCVPLLHVYLIRPQRIRDDKKRLDVFITYQFI